MSYRAREVFCIDCKKLFMKKHAKTVRCPDCQKAYNKKRQKELYKKRAKEVATAREKDPHICTRAKSCEYGGTLSNVPCCDYMIKLGYKRPCPVKNCTEYKKRHRAKGDEGLLNA